jgi:DNA-binding transcriptional LysR family regulator
MDLTLKQLRAFIAVAEAGSFTDAAKRSYVTQSGLSLMVKELETELGVRLFDRSTRKIKLSVAGADFYPLAVKVLQDLDNAVNSNLQLQDKLRGAIRIACTPLYASSLLPRALTEYKKRFPAIQVRLLDSLNEEALLRVSSGEADFAIAPQREPAAEILEEPLFRDRFEMVCPTDHPLAKRRRVSWQEVLSCPFISLTRDYTKRLQADLIAHSSELKVNPSYEVSFLTTALGLVNCGHGVTALPSTALPMISPLGLVTVRVDEPVVFRQVSFYAIRNQSLSPAAASFREFLKDFTAGVSNGPPARQKKLLAAAA